MSEKKLPTLNEKKIPKKSDTKIKSIQTSNAKDFDDILSGKAKNN